jgi:hypothetical protein
MSLSPFASEQRPIMDLNVAFMNGFPRVSAEGKQLKELTFSRGFIRILQKF